MKNHFLFAVAFCCALQLNAQQEVQDLSGTWRFQLDPMGFGKTPGSELYLSKLTESIMLPGSTDEGGKGILTTARHVDRLTRKFEYCGQAWYQREVVVPDSWAGKQITLHLERCHWETALYVDGQLVEVKEHLSVPNRFDLTKQLTPGMHTLTLCVDNRLKYPMDQWNHGTTEYTQTNWNGVVGDLELIARPSTYIHTLKTYPDITNRSLRIDLNLAQKAENDTQAELRLTLCDAEGKVVTAETKSITMKKGENALSTTLKLGKQMKLWNEFTPYLYKVKAELVSDAGTDTWEENLGMREVSQGKHHIQVNGRNVHLRGALDCCVFPLTGYPSTWVGDWERIFRTVKEYGLNHVRFHSWCPPEAAFDAADRVGLYLQVELPMWIKDVGQFPKRRVFFEKEMYAILEEYGNHPSFILMCNGNENEGDFSVLEDLVKKGQAHDYRHLYSASTARTHTPSDQYYTSHVTSKGWITVYEGQPSTDWDRSKESDIDCPVIAHETGQRCMYPNFDEMIKYTGVVQPRNFEVFRERLARNGMLHQADDFFRATGAHTVLQYKEVNESLLRTVNSGGFQLLGLSDFPGQGSAFVGILDAFWESKGLVTPEKYRESCAPTVLLARLPKRVFTEKEHFIAKMEIYHYGEYPIKRGKLQWVLQDESGKVWKKGQLSTPSVDCATVDSLGKVDVPLQEIDRPCKLTFRVALNGEYPNEWDIWVYPTLVSSEKTVEEYLLATDYTEEVRQALKEGRKVLLLPENPQGRKARFASHFWNPIMFNWDPMIVGTLIDKQHPAFSDFPTANYADWQWWDILNYATAMPLENLEGLTPVIQSVDSYEKNQKLGIAFEARVAQGGQLFVLCTAAHKDLEKRPAMQQLLRSVKRYVASEQFKPAVELKLHQLDALFDVTPQKKEEGGQNEAIDQLLNQ